MKFQTVQTFVDRNKEYAKNHAPPPSVADLRSMPSPGRVQTVIVICSDPRVHPDQFMQIAPGEATIVRVAGGRTVDALRSLIVLEGMVPLSTIAVIHHTDCGLTHQTNEAVRQRVKSLAPEHSKEIDEMEFGHIQDHKKALEEDVARVRDSPYLSKEIEVVGYLFDIKTGKLEQIVQK
ncbi:carbonic anhydrase [Xylogone sp. PMI_703]|nr:carbonic anhydrase [Xylogone sp. PMI_703]